MPFTKKDKARIAFALRNAERAASYLQNARIAVCRRGDFVSTTLHYTRADGAVLYEVTKEYGSDLCGLDNCIAELRSLLAPKTEASKHEQ